MKFQFLRTTLFIIFNFVVIYSLEKVESVTTHNGLNNKEGIYYLSKLKGPEKTKARITLFSLILSASIVLLVRFLPRPHLFLWPLPPLNVYFSLLGILA